MKKTAEPNPSFWDWRADEARLPERDSLTIDRFPFVTRGGGFYIVDVHHCPFFRCTLAYNVHKCGGKRPVRVREEKVPDAVARYATSLVHFYENEKP